MPDLRRMLPLLLTTALLAAPAGASAQESKEAAQPKQPAAQDADQHAPHTEPDGSDAPRFSKPVVFLGTENVERQATDNIGVNLFSFVNGMRYYIPRAWKPQSPKDISALVQMRVEAPQGLGMEDAIVSFYADLPGSVHNTIDTWLNEIENPEWTPEVGIWLMNLGDEHGLNMTLLTAVGTYTGPSMIGEPVKPAPDTMLLGVVIEGAPGGTLYIKAVGNKNILEPEMGWWQRMVRSFLVMEAPAQFPDFRVLRDARLKDAGVTSPEPLNTAPKAPKAE